MSLGAAVGPQSPAAVALHHHESAGQIQNSFDSSFLGEASF